MHSSLRYIFYQRCSWPPENNNDAHITSDDHTEIARKIDEFMKSTSHRSDYIHPLSLLIPLNLTVSDVR